ncbi:hypothetical protein [Neptuniibacter sp. CAU 1671]|uniref:hypothetical protein n=1 Tax=Neptuniibacter sp. CAU 1671 TaxID=3032593 RepID=UPI0023DBEC89|nr:hypothetical protein [Neptuniibacter sp. CAU 1671]MDF2180636.1 hypothetical protein [Neptuniibacter sp. CAU 1671]
MKNKSVLFCLRWVVGVVINKNNNYYSSFGEFLFKNNVVYYGFLVGFFLIFLKAFCMITLYPNSSEDAYWDEVCVDRIVVSPARWEFRAIYGVPRITGGRVIYQGYPESSISIIRNI